MRRDRRYTRSGRRRRRQEGGWQSDAPLCPLEQTVNGIHVVGWGDFEDPGDLTSPPGLADRDPRGSGRVSALDRSPTDPRRPSRSSPPRRLARARGREEDGADARSARPGRLGPLLPGLLGVATAWVTSAGTSTTRRVLSHDPQTRCRYRGIRWSASIEQSTGASARFSNAQETLASCCSPSTACRRGGRDPVLDEILFRLGVTVPPGSRSRFPAPALASSSIAYG